MRQSGNREELLAAIQREIGALEALCGSLESALMRRSWPELETAIADSRRVTHALHNAMNDALGVRDEEFDREIFRRIRYVHSVRENQMARLKQFSQAVDGRLQTFARWKAAMRSIGKPQGASRLASLNQIR